MASSGPNNPGTLADESSIGSSAWSNASNAASSDNTYATNSVSGGGISHYLKATNFGFAIDSGATIDGIVVEVEKGWPSGIGAPVDYRVRIVKGGVIGSTDKSSVDMWTVMDTYKTHGANNDLWGETWAAADINDSGFGFAISATNGGGMPADIQIDHIRITVYYTAGAPAGAAKTSTIVRQSVRRAAYY